MYKSKLYIYIYIYTFRWLVGTAFFKWPIAHSSDGRGSNMGYFWNDILKRKPSNTVTLGEKSCRSTFLSTTNLMACSESEVVSAR